MRISVYTFVKDGLYFDFHLVEMLKHHLPLADEVIVNEGYSTDGTYEAIKNLDPKIKVFRNEWDRSDPRTWRKKFVDQTRALCTGDWCVMLDADEFIPEWEFERIRQFCETTDKTIARVRYINFYGNYKVYHVDPAKLCWPERPTRIHRNVEGIEVWGDASMVRLYDGKDPSVYADEEFELHHFGAVRHAARLRQKWRIQNKRNRHYSDKKPSWDRTPGFLFDLSPHRWDDPDFLPDLALYDGPYIRPVRENPAEFTRDDLQLCRLLETRPEALSR